MKITCVWWALVRRRGEMQLHRFLSVPSLTPAVRWAVTRRVHYAGSLLQRSNMILKALPPLTGSFASVVTRSLPWLGVPQRYASVLPTFWNQCSDVVKKVNEEIESHQPSKVFAVVHISGRQFKVTQNDLIIINRIAADIGDQLYLEKVLLVASDNFSLIGTPILSNTMARVRATVIEHSKTAKIIVFKKKRRKNYKRKKGHRQDITVLRINSIDISTVNNHA